MKRWIAPAGLLLLAACSGGEKDGQAEKDMPSATPMVPEAAPAAPAAAQETPPDYVADPSVKPPAKPDAGIGTGDAAVPAAIQGRWALKAADCAARRGTDLTALVIDAKSLSFFESHGELAHIRERGATRLVADYKFSGEGMDWDRLMQLTVVDGGKTLVRRDYGEGAAGEPMRYTRCA